MCTAILTGISVNHQVSFLGSAGRERQGVLSYWPDNWRTVLRRHCCSRTSGQGGVGSVGTLLHREVQDCDRPSQSLVQVHKLIWNRGRSEHGQSVWPLLGSIQQQIKVIKRHIQAGCQFRQPLRRDVAQKMQGHVPIDWCVANALLRPSP